MERYDELLARAPSDIVRLNRAVAIGESRGPAAGLAELAAIDPAIPRHTAVSAWFHEQSGDLDLAAREYAEAARRATSEPERAHLARQAARLRALPSEQR